MNNLPPTTLSLASDLTTGEKGRRAASRLGDSLGERLLQKSHGPIDIHDVAVSENIEVVLASGLAESGRIEWAGGGLRIVLREGDGEQRQRFTLAHELGHHFIFGIEKDAKRTYSREEENRCDKFAAGLLMPRRKFESAFTRQSGQPRTLLLSELAKDFDVSLRSAMFRVNALGLVDPGWITLLLEVDSQGEHRVSAAAYDRTAYRPLEGMTTRQLGIDDALERTLSMPGDSGGVAVSARLPTKQRWLPRNSPSFVLGIVTGLHLDRLARRQMLAHIDLVVDPLRPRFLKPPRELQADLIAS